ncbi:carboxypeptidase family protein [Paenibacillus cellulosilyticus]|uniref:Carboxypeptidase family protein n=1 Tax=Paenibacillus cellulosilyticus TaxID=375489 RepID=A0A2V2YH10_9BACL|nr:carboxypeptidase regulatory-like domain-containing protein [Paenibacillus cellulosilyticus]PWV92502.1 carboxypeptidase family protein [Paenibacillus cellulosilyticus]QKS47070.1 carboxypeptidase regulatory-like domain-containing protein [Paenibacillus cellulosilyticus]
MSFPNNVQYVPVTLNGIPISDPVRDVSPDETDIVGDEAFPAAYYGYDGTNLYFRLRLNADPRFKTGFRNFAWGVLFDTDNDPSTYEAVLAVNGLDSTVDLIRNTVRIPNAFTDSAEGVDSKGQPNFRQSIINFDIARAQPTDDGSRFGGNANFFIDWFVRLSVLQQQLGITDQSSLRFLFFTATNNNNFNKDFIGPGTLLSSAFSDPLTINGGDVRAKLSLTQSAEGGPLTITGGAPTTIAGSIEVKNSGRSEAANVVVNAVFGFDTPISFEVRQTSMGNTAYNAAAQTLTWNVGNLAAGSDAVLQYTAQGVFNAAGTRTVDSKTATGIDLFTGAVLSPKTSALTAAVITTGAITGRVLDNITGLPLPGVAVQAVNAATMAVISSAVTAEAGVYSFPSLPPGSYVLQFAFPDYQSQSASVSVVVNTITTLNVLLVPLPANVLGTVTDAATDLPIVGAAVHLNDSNGAPTADALTDAAGQFALNGIFPGSYRISVEAPDYQLSTRPITLSAGATRTANFALSGNPGSVSGTVTGTNGAPVAGALVEVLNSRIDILAAVVTDASGQYAINSLTPTVLDRIRFSAQGYVTQIIGLQIVPGQNVVNAKLSPLAGSLTGVITDSVTGAPIVGASISVASDVGLKLQSAVTAADGTYTIPSLGPGSYTATIGGPGYASQLLGATIAAGTVTALSTALEQLAGAISGRVADIQFTPLIDAEVTIFTNNIVVAGVNTQEDGTFTVGGLSAGVYTVAAAVSGFGGTSQTITVNPAQTTETVLILLPLAGELTGTVTDTGGKPIAGATLALQLNVDGGSLAFVRFVTEQDGTYYLTNLAPLPFIVTASATGFQNGYVSIVITPGQLVTADFRLAPNPGSIEGTVVDVEGRPIAGAGAQVRLNNANGVTLVNLFTDTAGRFTASNMAPGTYAVVVSADRFQTSTATVAVESDQTAALQIALSPNPGSILGRVFDVITNLPALPAIVNVTDKNNLLLGSSLADNNGQVRIEGLPPGSYTLAVTAINYQGGTFGIIVQSDAIATAEFAVIPNPATIVGITLPPVAGIIVNLYNLNNVQVANAISQSDGSFVFISIREGSYYMNASATGYTSATVGVSVLPGETAAVQLPLTPNPGRLAGKIIDDSGNPVAGAVIRAMDSNETIRNVAQADASGSYVLDLLPAGLITAIASATNHGNAVVSATIGPGETVSSVNFTLASDPGSIAGQVTDAISGEPIQGADIEIRSGTASGLAVAHVTADGAGNFLFDGLRPGTYTVIVSADRYAANRIGAVVRSNQSTASNIALAPIFGDISGQVVDTTGNTVSSLDTRVRLFTKEGVLIDSIFVSPAGTFAIHNLLPGEYLLVAASPGFMTASIGTIVTAGIVTPVQAVLTTEISLLTGTVRNAGTGSGISGAQVTVYDLYGLAIDSTFTDEKGSFELRGLPAGNLTITAAAAGFGSESAGIVIESGSASQLQLSLTPNPGAVGGFVSNYSNGASLSGASVQIFNGSTGALIATVVSGSGGEYASADLAPGFYTAICNAVGFTSGLGGFDILAGETTRYSFALDPLPGQLRGMVNRATDNTAIPGSSIVIRQYNNFGPVVGSIITDGIGNYNLGDVTPANYSLSASKTGFLPQDTSTGILPNALTIVNFALQSVSIVVTGRVTDGTNGAPLPNTSVTIVDGSGSVVGNGVTDGSGQYTVPSVSGGERTIVASNPSRQTTVVFTPITQSSNQQVNLVLVGIPLTIQGIVTDNVFQSPVAGAIVNVLDQESNTVLATVFTSGDGSFTARGLAAGTYTVTASAQRLGSVARSAAAGAGNSGSLSLSAAFGTLTGTIRDAAGKPLYRALVEIVASGGELVRQVISNAAGSYIVTNLSAGAQRARFSFPSKQTKELNPIIIDQQKTVLDVILLDEEEE